MKNIVPALLFIAVLTGSCGGGKRDNQLTDEEKKEGWVLLFDGHSMTGWHLYHNDRRTPTWSVQNGELVCGPDRRLDHMDLVTDREYANFDLRFDWKINKEGNSGVFIDVLERPDIPATYASGPEYQLLEVTHADNKNPLQQTGCIFNLTRQLHPGRPTVAGEWNESRIRQKDGKVEFYLNGVLTTQADLRSSAWSDSIGKSHFSNYPEFGKRASGHIALQDWFKTISFKNMRIREL
ncbi:MAG TPA: DUF1080 domain-containing protein [Puia sp.]|nr:DUF1080 domain-containing protein [Puia sp.]